MCIRDSLLLCKKGLEGLGEKVRPLDLVLLYAFFALPTFDFVRVTNAWNNLTTAYLLMSLSLLLTLNRKFSLRRALCTLLLSIVTTLVYYTAALVLLLIFLSLTFVELVKGRRLDLNLVLASIIYTTLTVIYFQVIGFKLPFAMINILIKKRLPTRLSKLKVEETYTRIGVPRWWLALYGINAVTALLPILLLLLPRARRPLSFSNGLKWLLILVLMVLSFWEWGGLRGAIVRTMEYSPLILALSLADVYHVAYKRRPLLLLVRSLLLMAVLTATLTYLTNKYIMPAYITREEWNGILWYASLPRSDKGGLFTDFRLGTTFILFGELKVTGVMGAGANDFNLLQRIYYDVDPYEAWRTLLNNGEGVNYLFLSRGMTKDYPGIVGWWRQFRPMPKVTLENYNNFPAFDKVYSNDGCYFYKVNKGS